LRLAAAALFRCVDRPVEPKMVRIFKLEIGPHTQTTAFNFENSPIEITFTRSAGYRRSTYTTVNFELEKSSAQRSMAENGCACHPRAVQIARSPSVEKQIARYTEKHGN
jgi:hypothetical protein